MELLQFVTEFWHRCVKYAQNNQFIHKDRCATYISKKWLHGLYRAIELFEIFGQTIPVGVIILIEITYLLHQLSPIKQSWVDWSSPTSKLVGTATIKI